MQNSYLRIELSLVSILSVRLLRPCFSILLEWMEGVLGVVCGFLAAGGEKGPILLCLVVRTDAMS